VAEISQGGGRLNIRRMFLRMDATTGNERQLTVAGQYASGVKRMSADDDDQANQQHELADSVT